MVRPQEGGSSLQGQPLSRCTDPAGASPVPVSTGAPGSRPQAREEISASQAGRQEPLTWIIHDGAAGDEIESGSAEEGSRWRALRRRETGVGGVRRR